MSAAVSPTVRVMSPAWTRCAEGLDGNMGMTP